MELEFSVTDAPHREHYDKGLSALRAFTSEMVGPPDNHEFAIVISHPETRNALGGLWAQSRWGGFYIEMLVVPVGYRAQGIGSRLMKAAEAEARRRGCHHMWLDTYSFQARPFYERHGFEVFGQLDGPAPIYPRYFMRKELG